MITMTEQEKAIAAKLQAAWWPKDKDPYMIAWGVNKMRPLAQICIAEIESAIDNYKKEKK